MAQLPDLPALMTVAEVAQALRLTDETVHRWCREGRLQHVDVLGVKRFHRTYIESLVRGDVSEVGAA
jgi:excisionase family DNA binding protein